MNGIPAAIKQLYYEQVWALVREVPLGRVATYGQIAKLIQTPACVSAEDYRMYAARWVGMALAACPGDVPWQRIVNSQGKISQRPEAGKQKQLLLVEGVSFSNDRLSLNEFQWRGPDVCEDPVQTSLF